jgi:hypothetical protein
MIFAMARQRTNVVTCVSCTRAPDGTHEHVTSLTLRTPGGHAHRITIGDAIIQLRHPLGERYLAHAPKSGDRTEVVLGACPICRQQPHMRLKGGGRVEDLARCSSDDS